MAENLKRTIWVAPGTVANGVRTFGTPTSHRWNWRALSSSAEMMAFGPEYLDYRTANMDNARLDNIKQFDRVWMDGVPTAPLDPLANSADFYVVSAVKGAGGIGTVTLKRLSPDGA